MVLAVPQLKCKTSENVLDLLCLKGEVLKNALDKLISSCKTLFVQLPIFNLLLPFEEPIFLFGRFRTEM